MSYYIYRYAHPDYPYLYIGQTTNLESRIKSHDTNSSDNIERQYTDLLQESTVFFFEVNGRNQMNYIESYLIDKYKPYLNKRDNFSDRECIVEMKLPEWQVYENRNNNCIDSGTHSLTQLYNEIEIAKNKIDCKQKILDDLQQQIIKKSHDLANLKAEISMNTNIATICANNSNKENLLLVPYSFIEDFYDKFPQSDIIFTSKVYSQIEESSVCVVGNNQIIVTYCEEESQTINRKDVETAMDNFLYQIIPATFSSFSRFQPSSPLCIDMLITFYTNKILETKREYYNKIHDLPIKPYKDILSNIPGNIPEGSTKDYIIIGKEISNNNDIVKYIKSKGKNSDDIYYLADELIDYITVGNYHGVLQWETVRHIEYKSNDRFYIYTYNLSNKELSEQICHTWENASEKEKEYVHDISQFINKADFNVLDRNWWAELYKLERDIDILTEKYNEVTKLLHKP